MWKHHRCSVPSCERRRRCPWKRTRSNNSGWWRNFQEHSCSTIDVAGDKKRKLHLQSLLSASSHFTRPWSHSIHSTPISHPHCLTECKNIKIIKSPLGFFSIVAGMHASTLPRSFFFFFGGHGGRGLLMLEYLLILHINVLWGSKANSWQVE